MPRLISSCFCPWIRQRISGVDHSWLRNRTVLLERTILLTTPGVAVLSPGTNATETEWNRSNKQGLWKQERAVEPCLAAN